MPLKSSAVLSTATLPPARRLRARAARFLVGLGYWCGRAAALVAAFGVLRGLLFVFRERRRCSATLAVKLPGGDSVLCRVGRGQCDLRTLLQVWWQECYSFKEVRDPRWIIDAGAHVGYATRWFATRYPRATVVAIEPDHANAELLRMNTAGLRNVMVLEAALGEGNGRGQLLDPGGGPWSYRVQREDLPWSGGVPRGEVEVVSLAAVIEKLGINRIGLLKVDIEGAELELFAGSGSWIAQVDAIVAELHDRFRPGCTRAFVGATHDFLIIEVRGESVFIARRG